MTETENVPAILVPHTGELISVEDAAACAVALREIRAMESKLRETKGFLADAILQYRARLGLSGTIDFPNGVRATVRSGDVTEYDAEEIMQGLRDAGMPEERIAEIVKETVTYSVAAVEAKKAAKANPEYDAIISRHSRLIERPPSVSVAP